MRNIRHIQCFRCAGEIGYTAIDRVVSCRFCQARMFIDNPDWVAEYRLTPSLEALDARRVLQRFLSDPAMPKGMLRHARFQTATRYWVPYNDVRVRRLGTVLSTTDKPTARDGEWRAPLAPQRLSLLGPAQSSERGSLFSSLSSERETVRDTSVVIGDIHRIAPAVDHADLGLEHTAAQRFLQETDTPLVRFDRVDAARTGHILYPTHPTQALLAQLETAGPIAVQNSDTEYTEYRARRVYYPIWHLQYAFDNRLYTATVDAMTGDLLHARAPESDHRRSLVLLSLLALFGLFIGRGLHDYFADRAAALAAHVDAAAIPPNPLWFVHFTIITLAALMVISAGWAALRYPSEIVQRGPARTLERPYHPPGRIWRWLAFLVDPRHNWQSLKGDKTP
ncbi:MAG: hypothetical protein GX146_07730 [Myxococcales bacterium]|jgi:hypothetical protein|nr:hypothetical protein [Myxococcales bacterium]